ncbi:hypothetical protein ALFP_2278 [Alcaligenes faecalis]|nr:hypothetical protein ALFP_2278 [Alcaligenes faecalis]
MKSLDNQAILIETRRGRLWPRMEQMASAMELSCLAFGNKKKAANEQP